MKIIAQIKCAGGNESVGESWTEVKVFHETATLKEVLAWQTDKCNRYLGKADIILSVDTAAE